MTLKDDVDTDLDNVFFKDATEFNTPATYTPLGVGGPPVAVNVVFDREYIEINVGTPGIEGDQPIALGKAADFPNVKHGDSLNVNAINYTIVNPKPDGTGMILLVLKEP